MNIRRTETPVALPVPVAASNVPARSIRDAARTSSDGFTAGRTNGILSPRQTAQLRGDAGQSRPVTSILPGDMPVVAPGPLSLNSKAARTAITASQQYLAMTLNLGRPGSETGIPEFKAAKVEMDTLGMTHVRMDRYQDGVKVFGEQVIAHLDAAGKVVGLSGAEGMEPIPASASREAITVDEKQAVEISEKTFGRKSQHKPQVEPVLVKQPNGEYVKAFQVEVNDFNCDHPCRQNYLIDARDGQVIESWNQMDGVERSHSSDVVGRPGRSDEITVTRTAEPKLPIADLSTVTSKITIDDQVTAEQLQLNLDIAHPWSGDLKISLTSPSGKTVVVRDRQGGSIDDVKGTVDLSDAFAGEKGEGEWTLTVEDAAKLDSGTLNSWGLTITGRGTAKPQGDDTSLYSGAVDLSTTRNADGTFKLLDSTRGGGVETRDAQNKANANGSKEITDNNNTWGEASDPARNAAAVDAHYGAQMTYDFYKNVLGRDSIDGKGEKLVNNVHIRSNYVNAFWDGTQMNYGDGDGRTSGPLTTLDIAGHEITHGLTERTAGLLYRGESGGINESMSDIMGTGVEWFASQKNSAVKFDFTLGEDCWTPNDGDDTDGLRYMDDPTKDGYSVDNYANYPKQTEVHGSSGIMNNAFTLLAKGGTNRTSGIAVADGIGMEKALQIYGRALMFYMTPSTTFAQARTACLNAAKDLFGADSAEVKKVQEAWTAVGVN